MEANYFEMLKKKSSTWLVTGVAGFIGSNLLEALLRNNQKVVGVDNFFTGNNKNLEQVRGIVGSEVWKNFKLIEGDICNLDLCKQACQGVDYVLHQAALGSVPRSIKDPIQVNQVNIDGFLNMMLSARDAKVKRFVYASSSSVYGDHPDLPKSEEYLGNPLSPYAVTKRANEVYAGVFHQCYGLEVVGLRYFNVFGPRQDPLGEYAAVIPRWILSMIQGGSVYVNGDGSTSRDFCYVENVVQANILAATVQNAKAVNQVFNIAVGQKSTLNELLSYLDEELRSRFPHFGAYKKIVHDFRPGDIKHSLASISKAESLLGYAPTHTLRQGLKESLRWYVENLQ